MTTLETNDVLISTQKVIEEALRKLGYGQDMIELLKEPMSLLTVRIPIRMDDGKTKFLSVTGHSIMMR